MQNLLPVKEETAAVDADVTASTEQKSQAPSCSTSVVSFESLLAERRRRRHSGEDSTRESSPGSDRGSRGGPAITERILRDRMLPSEDRSVGESSPVSDRGSRCGPAITDRILRDRMVPCEDHNVGESSPVSDRGSRASAAVNRERILRDRMVHSIDHAEDQGGRESSPVSDHGLRGGPSNIDRSLRDRTVLVGDRCMMAKERIRVKRDVSGTASSSASTCSEDSELRINDFLGKTDY